MSDTSTSPITNVADTAFWVAVARAHESERPDALFHDPYARLLAGERPQLNSDTGREQEIWPENVLRYNCWANWSDLACSPMKQWAERYTLG